MRPRAEGTHKSRPHVAETLRSTVHHPYIFIGAQGTRLDSIYSVHCAADFGGGTQVNEILSQRRANDAWCLSTPHIVRISHWWTLSTVVASKDTVVACTHCCNSSKQENILHLQRSREEESGAVFTAAERRHEELPAAPKIF